jgi:hypothetical protein
MKDFSVIRSFASATLASSEKNNQDDDESQSSGSSGSYIRPSIENAVLAPYNFSFA